MHMRATATTHYRMGFLWMICLVAAMGGLLFGYDWVVIGGAKPFYEPYFGISDSPFSQGLAMSGALFGCLVGAAASGMLTDRYGRKWLLILAAFLFTASAIGTARAGVHQLQRRATRWRRRHRPGVESITYVYR